MPAPGPLPNLHAFRLFFSPRLIRFFSSPGFTASLLLFILSLSTPSPFLPLLSSWCFLSLCPFCLPLRSFSFSSSPFLAPFSSSFSFPFWCLFCPSSPLPGVVPSPFYLPLRLIFSLLAYLPSFPAASLLFPLSRLPSTPFKQCNDEDTKMHLQ